MAEFFPGEMVGIVSANNIVIWIIYALILPNLDPKQNDNEYIYLFSLVFGVGAVCAAIGIALLVYETHGRNRTYFYQLLRG